MKVRIQGDSLRFRLKSFEVEAFEETGFVKEEIVFGEESFARLQFILRSSVVKEIEVAYEPGKIIVSVPQPVATEWTTTALVGFDSVVKFSSGKTVKVLIEKDFKCLDGLEQDNIGSYPNPMEAC